MGILQPDLLNEVRLKQAANRCRAALRRAPGPAEAEAGLAMIEALEGDAEAAKVGLTRIKDDPNFLPYYWIARFWILAKFYEPELAIESLKASIERKPASCSGAATMATRCPCPATGSRAAWTARTSGAASR